MLEKFRDALFWETHVYDDYEKRRKAIRIMIDILVEEYGKTCLEEENDKRVQKIIEEYKQDTEPLRIDFPHWLRPLRTVSEIARMDSDEGWKYQYIYKLKGGTAWLASDSRFLNGGRNMRFYKAAEARRKTFKDGEYDYCRRDDVRYVENEITTEDLLEYQQRIESGEEHFEVAHQRGIQEFVPNYQQPVTIDGKEWPTVEHYILAQRTTYEAVAEQIRGAKNSKDARVIASKAEIRLDWASICDDVIRRALVEKFKDLLMRCRLIHTFGFSIRFRGNKDWDSEPRAEDRYARLLMEIREEIWNRCEGDLSRVAED